MRRVQNIRCDESLSSNWRECRARLRVEIHHVARVKIRRALAIKWLNPHGHNHLAQQTVFCKINRQHARLHNSWVPVNWLDERTARACLVHPQRLDVDHALNSFANVRGGLSTAHKVNLIIGGRNRQDDFVAIQLLKNGAGDVAGGALHGNQFSAPPRTWLKNSTTTLVRRALKNFRDETARPPSEPHLA